MLNVLSQRLLPALQLTRMALVFTAISNAQCTLLLRAQRNGEALWQPGRMALMAIISIGLYGFGMSLNDIIDRRRDRQIAAHRPLPSGRIGVFAAHSICSFLALAALVSAVIYARMMGDGGWMVILLTVWTGLLITFYDYAGKYLVAPGILTLGLIRFFHAVICAPHLPLLWHPLLLLNHVALLSAVAYVWEEKRPPLTKVHWWAVVSGLAVFDGLSIVAVMWRWRHAWPRELEAGRGMAGAGIAGLVFVGAAWWIRRANPNLRASGQKLMLFGLLWLIVYDTAFTVGYVGWLPAVFIALLLPLAYLSVQLMRWWSQLMLLSQRPEFKRAES